MIKKSLIIIAALIGISLILGPYIYYAIKSPLFGSPSPEGFAYLGSYIGGVIGSIFASMSAGFLFFTYREQKKQLLLAKQDTEYALSRNALPSIMSTVDRLFEKKIASYITKRQVGSEDLQKIAKENFDAGRVTIQVDYKVKNEISSLQDLVLHKESSNDDSNTSSEFCSSIARALNGDTKPKLIDLTISFRKILKSISQVNRILNRLRAHHIPELYFATEIEWRNSKVMALEEILKEIKRDKLNLLVQGSILDFYNTLYEK